MPLTPLTIADRIAAIGGAAIVCSIVLCVGFAIHQAIAARSPAKRIHGRPIVWWVTFLMFLGSCLGAWIADNQRYHLREVVGGMGGFGLLAGLVVGNAHGWISLNRAKNTAASQASDPLSETSITAKPYAGNPYVPPQIPK